MTKNIEKAENSSVGFLEVLSGLAKASYRKYDVAAKPLEEIVLNLMMAENCENLNLLTLEEFLADAKIEFPYDLVFLLKRAGFTVKTINPYWKIVSI